MDNGSSTALPERTANNVNGSARRHSPAVSPSHHPHGGGGIGGRPVSLMDSNHHHQPHTTIVRVVVNKDERGYGMKVSGDNPVYVQSVKEGGAAEKAGLHAGDKIIKVNGVNVMNLMHTDVVDLIKSSSQVVLTVQQRTTAHRAMGSPSLHNRPATTHSRITGPQPVDNEKQYQLQLEREQHYRLMIEKEQRYVDQLRSQIALSPDEKKCAELAKTEKNLQTLQLTLQRHLRNQQTSELQSPPTPSNSHSPHPHHDTPPPLPNSPPPKLENLPKSPNGNSDTPPPLPKRNNNNHYTKRSAMDVNSAFISAEAGLKNSATEPPPLPPRAPATPVSAPPPSSRGVEVDAANSLSKQMSYPLVATCTPLHNSYAPNHTHHHHRTKSSPESLTTTTLSPAEASRRLIASESMNDLSRPDGWDATAATPPGTPPPPYPSPLAGRKQAFSNRSSANTEDGDVPYDESTMETSSTEVSPLRGSGPSPGEVSCVLANSSPIHAATPQTAQQSIISMEGEDDASDQEMFEDHGPYKSLSLLREHIPHLAVFTNYVLSNADPNSLLFYLLTDLYKEGNAKEMRKWAFEIHSCFLVPGAPLMLCNVDENVAREIDAVLTKEYDREEMLRKVFWRARNRAKEEVTRQLADFRQKRIAGLATIYGPNDSTLFEICHDKAREQKLYENLFLDKLEPYLDEVERESYEPVRYYTAAALTTVITRIFGVRSTLHPIDRFPTFVNKEKSFRTKFIKYSRKLNIQGHQFLAQVYYIVETCRHCHQIIYGIGPQGYQCSLCLINLHRACVKLYDDTCPGPINKSKGFKILRIMQHESSDNRRKHSAQSEKERKQMEGDSGVDTNETGETKPGHPVTRTGSDRRPDSVREESSKGSQDSQDNVHDKHGEDDTSHTESSISLPAATSNKRRTSSNINRSESVREQSDKEKRKQRRNISDPLHNTSNDHKDLDLDSQGIAANSGSSSNSSLSSNSRLSESPSNNSGDANLGGGGGGAGHPTGSEWDSDMEVETDPPDWQTSVPPDDLANLPAHEKKRQDVINELFHTERSHVRNLKVLDIVFMKPLANKQCLKPEELSLVFPNLNELLDIHVKFNNAMKNKRKEGPIVKDVGDLLVNMFDGAVGETFQNAAATFCERQQLALEFIKEKRKKDSRFETILSDCEKSNLCRRLPLQGIIPTQMQRLSKYPLLLERLIAIVEKNLELDAEFWQTELNKLRQAHDRSKEILKHVNEAAKLACNRARLEEIQRHLDTSNFPENRNIDLTEHKFIYEGDMFLKRQNKGPVQVRALLLEEMLVLLQREGEKYFLKYFQVGVPGQPLSPIIKTNTLLFRENAISNSSMYIVNMSSQKSQMYDLQCRDYAERKVWFKHLSDATDAYQIKEGKPKQSDHNNETEEETVQELPPSSSREATERAESVGGTTNETSPLQSNAEGGEASVTEEKNGGGGAAAAVAGGGDVSSSSEEDKEKRLTSQTDGGDSGSSNTLSAEVIGGGQQPKVAADDWPLIQPSEVQVAVPPVLTAEPRLTPLEQLRRKDEEVRQALADKQILVADLLSIPREDFQHIADMASEDMSSDISSERDSSEYVLAPLYQVNQLLEAVNDALNISEVDPILATGGKHASCASNEALISNKKSEHVPSVPAHKIRDIVTTLSTQLTTLLGVVKQRDAERERLRKELHRLREQCHEKNSLHGHVEDNISMLDSIQSGDLESIEESPTENES